MTEQARSAAIMAITTAPGAITAAARSSSVGWWYQSQPQPLCLCRVWCQMSLVVWARPSLTAAWSAA